MRSKFDKEYATQWRDEVKYLHECGINFTFVKRLNGIDTYKYEKTSELFEALVSFYNLRTKIE